MDEIVTARFLKLLSVALLFAGTLGAVLAKEAMDRQRALFFLAGPAFFATWGLGFYMAYLLRHSLFSGWVLGAMGLSFLSLNVALFGSARERRPPLLVSVLALAPLVASLALMVYRG